MATDPEIDAVAYEDTAPVAAPRRASTEGDWPPPPPQPWTNAKRRAAVHGIVRVLPDVSVRFKK